MRDHAQQRASGRFAVAGFGLAAVLAVLLTGVTPQGNAATYQRPDAFCFRAREYRTVPVVRPRACKRFLVGYGSALRPRYLRVRGARWPKWRHDAAVGTIWVRHRAAGGKQRVIRGRRYGKVQVRLSAPRRYVDANGNTTGWFYGSVRFRRHGRWVRYWRAGDCDLWTGRDCR